MRSGVRDKDWKKKLLPNNWGQKWRTEQCFIPTSPCFSSMTVIGWHDGLGGKFSVLKHYGARHMSVRTHTCGLPASLEYLISADKIGEFGVAIQRVINRLKCWQTRQYQLAWQQHDTFAGSMIQITQTLSHYFFFPDFSGSVAKTVSAEEIGWLTWFALHKNLSTFVRISNCAVR